MKLVFIAATSIFALGACAYEPPQCGLPNEPVVIGKAKDGGLIYDDQATLSAPCPTVTPPNVSQPPVGEPPVGDPEPPVTPEPPTEPTKGNHPNSGRGNGSELDGNGNDVDPGNSGGRNKGGD